MQCNEKLVRNVAGIDEKTLHIFQGYAWPGNVRELQHAIEHAMNILPDDACTITPDYLPRHIGAAPAASVAPPQPVAGSSLPHTIKGIERSAICQALREHHGNISETARALQISRQNLQYRIKRYQIDLTTLLRGE